MVRICKGAFPTLDIALYDCERMRCVFITFIANEVIFHKCVNLNIIYFASTILFSKEIYGRFTYINSGAEHVKIYIKKCL